MQVANSYSVNKQANEKVRRYFATAGRAVNTSKKSLDVVMTNDMDNTDTEIGGY